MTDTTASIAAKGLEGTGVTEDLAAELFHKVGKSLMAIVELQVTDKHGPNIKGKRKVTLSLTQVWPAEDDNLDDHLRQISRVLHQNHGLRPGPDGSRQEIAVASGDGVEPTVDAVINANPGLKPHTYVTSMLAVDDTDAGPVCDVCGKTESDVVHRAAVSDPFEVPAAEDDEPEPEVWREPYDDPHVYVPGPDDSCECGAPEGNPIHVDLEDPEPTDGDADEPHGQEDGQEDNVVQLH